MSVFTDIEDWCFSCVDTTYCTTKALSWEVGKKGSGLWLTVPSPYSFDVSVPRALWWMFSPHDKRYLKAAALHDYALDQGWASVAAASLFSQALMASGVGRIERYVMTLSVIIWRWSKNK